MKKYQRGFMQGLGQYLAQAFFTMLALFFVGGIAVTMFFIYVVPAIWEWIKPFIHTMTS